MNLSEIPVLGFNMHLAQSFPEFKDKITIQLGKDQTVIEFILKNGFDDNFKVFFQICIKLKSAVDSCKRNGIKKLVFINPMNKTFEDITIEKLEQLI